nr:hypothetical protein [Tanacetum cinerariifolium]
MGYEKPSTKLTFYKAFFSTQWKFFIHTILHSLSAKRTSWNKFSFAMASALICLSSVRAVDAEEEVQVSHQDDVVQEHVIDEIATEVVPLTPTSPSPSSPVGTSQRIKSSDDVEKVFNQGRISVDMKTDEGIDLEVDQEKSDEVEGRQADIQAEIYNIDLDYSSKEAQKADDLRGRLEIVQDEDDDVFVEAIPLAQNVLVVDYQVVVIDNKPRYKIIRADDTHQFYISFTTLLNNFNREDLETLWRIVKDRFSTKKPTIFLDEYLLLTLKKMFGELDEQDAIWRNQKSVHGLA